MVSAVLYAPIPCPPKPDRCLDVVAAYAYDSFAQALTEAALETTLTTSLPPDLTGQFLLVHTNSIDHEPVSTVCKTHRQVRANQIVPLQTGLSGALHSVLMAGAPAAIEKTGYGCWLNKNFRSGAPGGLVVLRETARQTQLPVLETYGEAVVIGGAAPLPDMLALCLLSVVSR